jgi:hypothetical protein
MTGRDLPPIDPATPSTVGGILARNLFRLRSPHRVKVQSVARALHVSDDTASRILSSERDDGRDPTLVEVGAIVEHAGPEAVCRALALELGLTVAEPAQGPRPSASSVCIAFGQLLAAVERVDADQVRTPAELVDLRELREAIVHKLDRLCGGGTP